MASHRKKEESEALEIIEVAINDIDTLTRAFKVIDAVCSEQNKKHKSHDKVLSKRESSILFH